jgi:hypothetical protein
MFTDPNKWYPGCPPLEAAEDPHSLVVYRIVETDPPGAHDFQSHFELGKPLPRKVDRCRWRSVSVYKDLPDARKTVAFLKKRRNLQVLNIARGTLEAMHGVVLHTPSNGDSHRDWWPCDDVDRLQPFAMIEQV